MFYFENSHVDYDLIFGGGRKKKDADNSKKTKKKVTKEKKPTSLKDKTDSRKSRQSLKTSKIKSSKIKESLTNTKKNKSKKNTPRKTQRRSGTRKQSAKTIIKKLSTYLKKKAFAIGYKLRDSVEKYDIGKYPLIEDRYNRESSIGRYFKKFKKEMIPEDEYEDYLTENLHELSNIYRRYYGEIDDEILIYYLTQLSKYIQNYKRWQEFKIYYLLLRSFYHKKRTSDRSRVYAIKKAISKTRDLNEQLYDPRWIRETIEKSHIANIL